MAKVTRIPLGRKPGQPKIDLPEQVEVSLAELAGKTKQGLLAFAVAVGLDVFHTLLEEDVTTIVGDKGKHNPGPGRLSTHRRALLGHPRGTQGRGPQAARSLR